MTQEEFDKSPLLNQILYDKTGMLAENHTSIAEAMEEYHQAKLKLLGIGGVNQQREQFCKTKNLIYIESVEIIDGGKWIKDGGKWIKGSNDSTITHNN